VLSPCQKAHESSGETENTRLLKYKAVKIMRTVLINPKDSMSFRFAFLLGLATLAGHAVAAPDEIQVYDDELDAPGTFGVELHSNYVLSGSRNPAFIGQTPTHHVLQVTPEFSYGINKQWEAGLYFPPLALTPSGKIYVNGLRPRLKYIAPKEGDEGFFWGVNTEIGYFSRRVSEAHWGGEIRPILGYRAGQWTAVINPILDFSLSGNVSRTPDFEPSIKLSWQMNEELAIGLEHYAALGPVNNLLASGESAQSTFAVVDWKYKGYDVNLGFGHGNSQNEDRNIIKLILALPL